MRGAIALRPEAAVRRSVTAATRGHVEGGDARGGRGRTTGAGGAGGLLRRGVGSGRDGLGALGQFCYYDARVPHGHGDAPGNVGFTTIRRRALDTARPPSQGGDESAYLHAFLDARLAALTEEPSHTDTSRIDTAQRAFLREGNLRLDPPPVWQVYGDTYRIEE